MPVTTNVKAGAGPEIIHGGEKCPGRPLRFRIGVGGAVLHSY